MSADYYQVLGIEKNASKDDVKKAYRKLAHKHHPDKQGGDEKKFKEISEAYYVLSDDNRRARYDQYGQAFNAGQGGGGAGFDPNFWQNVDFGEGFGGFSDIFEDMFGFGGGKRRQKRGHDISIDIEVPFEESIFGGTRTVVLRKTTICAPCDGSGAEPGSKTSQCKACAGSGTVREQRRTFFGAVNMLQECVACKGKGTIPEKKCKTCGGAGIEKREEKITIAIPSGIENGEMMRMTGQGEAISGGVAGDLYIKIYVQSHPFLKRHGAHLMMDLEIPMTEAVLGGERMIESVDGKIKIKVPEGIDSGEMLRVRGRGVPTQAGKKGDLLIRVLVKNPKKLSREAKKLIEKLREEGV